MKIVAITAEFNPLHIGHIQLIEQAKALAPDILLVIMNGNITQRGSLAVLDKYTRARHALKAGADIVLELPQIFGASCAERFADAAVKILSAIHDDEKIMIFGSEDGDISTLQNAANILEEEPVEISTDLKELMNMGFSYPSARAQAFADYAFSKKIKVADLTKPNNILAIEYLRAINRRGGITPITVKRNGDYSSTTINQKAPSASAIREAISVGNSKEALSVVPSYVAEDLKNVTFEDRLSPILKTLCLYFLDKMVLGSINWNAQEL